MTSASNPEQSDFQLRRPAEERPPLKLPDPATSSPPPATTTEPSSPGQDDVGIFLNRELAWLEFNRRVLHQALDTGTPLLQRVRFLSIFTSNLDEFFMKRVGGLKRQVAMGVASRTHTGITPAEQLVAIRETLLPMLEQQATCYEQKILPALAEAGIHLLRWSELTTDERQFVNNHFEREVFPVLTPLSFDPGHPFPFISNLSVSLAVAVQHPNSDEPLFSRVKVPDSLKQWVALHDGNGGPCRFVSLMDVIEHNIELLFPGMRIRNVMPFRLTRNADVERDEEDTEDLLEMIEQELRQRRFERAVRLETGRKRDPWMHQLLMEELALHDSDIYELPAPLNFRSLDEIADLPLPHHHYPAFTPAVPTSLIAEDADIFSAIRQSDILVHSPYESFSASVERFIRNAADDPKVLAIKMTMYRTGDDSPFVSTLIRAAEAGIQVVCLVELKARFDEQRNVQLAQELEKAGIHVVYGMVGYKTHTKMAVVVRREADGLHSYAHIGTGNYHTGTASLYTDLGLFTSDPNITGEILQLFNHLTGRSLQKDYRNLLVAPLNMKDRFYEMIDREIAHVQAGRSGHIVAKMNSLEHRGICRALYRASAAGVSVDLIVRGFCCLRPGVPGLSENIRVLSVIGRFLEHSRLFHFRNGCENPIDGEFYIGSADWMHRNLLARVEAITPIEQRSLREQCWRILTVMLEDRRQAWDMQPDGSYILRTPDDPERDLGTHETLLRLARPTRA